MCVPTTGANAAIPTGKVFMFSSKTTSRGQRKLFQFSVNMMTAAAIIGARAKGRAIRAKRRNGPAPSNLAASINSLGNVRKNCRKIYTEKTFIKVGWASTYQALILPTIANVFSVYIFRQFFLTFPKELIEAARLDGAGPFRLFALIALPLARAPMIAAAVIIFTLNWNNFLWPLLVVFDENMKTLPVGIAAFAPVVGTHTQLEGYSVSMAGITVLSVPSLLLFFFLQKYFIQGISQGGLSQ